MTPNEADVLLVGSVPGTSVENVFRTCGAAIGGNVFALPDGELEDRNTWVGFLAWNVYRHHPDIVTKVQPDKIPGKPDWVPAGYHDIWRFAIKPDVTELRFERLGYADHAISSYDVLRRLRDEGAVPNDIRLQVCLPLTESSFRWFFDEGKDFDLLCAGFRDAVQREIDAITSAIPAHDLAIQWDVCNEILAVEANDVMGDLPFAFDPPGDPFDRYLDNVEICAAMVPTDVPMGLHICYGDLGHRHLIEPTDLGNCVRFANEAYRVVDRSIDFFHMPVPRDRTDDAYFEPLKDLSVGNAKVFIGLVHHTDGIEGTLARIETAKRHIQNFGIATECGLGRRPLEQVPELLQTHITAASRI